MIVDSHCHLDFPELAGDLPGVVARAGAAGVGAMLTISTRVAAAPALIALARAWPNVACSVGTHPHNAAEEAGVTAADLVALAGDPKVVAIGEAGLDYHYPGDYGAQALGFRRHIAAARATGLPIVIHAREADADIGTILAEEMARGRFTGVLHCYTSGRDLALRGVDLGLYVSFSGVLTFKKSGALRALATELPLDRLLVETDAPFLAPEPHRGKRCEPAHTALTARVLAECRGLPYDALAAATTANFFRLFGRAAAAMPGIGIAA